VPVVKSHILNEEAGTLNVQVKSGADLGGSTATFSKTKAGMVYKSRSRPTDAKSAKQLWQRQLYKDADCLWKSMTAGQRALWYSFNMRHPAWQAGSASEEGKPTLWTKQHVSKRLSARQNFMKRALLFNIEPFLSEYLNAMISIYDLSWQDDRLTATVKLEKIPEGTAPSPYEVDYDIYRMRRW